MCRKSNKNRRNVSVSFQTSRGSYVGMRGAQYRSCGSLPVSSLLPAAFRSQAQADPKCSRVSKIALAQTGRSYEDLQSPTEHHSGIVAMAIVRCRAQEDREQMFELCVPTCSRDAIEGQKPPSHNPGSNTPSIYLYNRSLTTLILGFENVDNEP